MSQEDQTSDQKIIYSRTFYLTKFILYAQENRLSSAFNKLSVIKTGKTYRIAQFFDFWQHVRPTITRNV